MTITHLVLISFCIFWYFVSFHFLCCTDFIYARLMRLSIKLSLSLSLSLCSNFHKTYSLYTVCLQIISTQAIHVCLASLFTTRRYASTVYAFVVCVSVCLSHAGIVSQQLNVESRKQRQTITWDSSFLTPNISAKFEWRHPQWGVPNVGQAW